MSSEASETRSFPDKSHDATIQPGNMVTKENTSNSTTMDPLSDSFSTSIDLSRRPIKASHSFRMEDEIPFVGDVVSPSQDTEDKTSTLAYSEFTSEEDDEDEEEGNCGSDENFGNEKKRENNQEELRDGDPCGNQSTSKSSRQEDGRLHICADSSDPLPNRSNNPEGNKGRNLVTQKDSRDEEIQSNDEDSTQVAGNIGIMNDDHDVDSVCTPETLGSDPQHIVIHLGIDMGQDHGPSNKAEKCARPPGIFAIPDQVVPLGGVILPVTSSPTNSPTRRGDRYGSLTVETKRSHNRSDEEVDGNLHWLWVVILILGLSLVVGGTVGTVLHYRA